MHEVPQTAQVVRGTSNTSNLDGEILMKKVILTSTLILLSLCSTKNVQAKTSFEENIGFFGGATAGAAVGGPATAARVAMLLVVPPALLRRPLGGVCDQKTRKRA